MTEAQLAHAKKLLDHLQLMLDAVVSRRTPGKWSWGWREDTAAPGSVYAMARPGHARAVAMCPAFGARYFAQDAAFITLAAANDARNLRCLHRALAELLNQRFRFQVEGFQSGLQVMEAALEEILADWPENVIDDQQRVIKGPT